MIFLALDGVLADFAGHYEKCFGIIPAADKGNVDWQRITGWPDFYLSISPVEDLPELLDYVMQFQPQVLIHTVPNDQSVLMHKHLWCQRHLPKLIVQVVPLAMYTAMHGERGDILIDVWDGARTSWQQEGGYFILHSSAQSTIAQLTKLRKKK